MEYNFKRNDRIEIDWLDIVDDPEWSDDTPDMKIPSEAYSRSIGYFYKQSHLAIWLSASINHRKKKGQRSTQFIPKGTIQKIRKLVIQRKG